MQNVDPAECRERFDQLTQVLARIVLRAEEASTRRCPYRNRHDQCTASFGCRNKRKCAGGLPVCAGDQFLTY
ncbi:MAG: hypothetical protein U0Q18_08805 [Bryobacteraceae bacterium]